MKLSQFGQKLAGQAAIVSLMEDLGEALNVNPDLLLLGGGNPAHIPEFEAEVAKHLQAIAQNPESVHKLIGVYQSPQGSESFIDAFVSYVRNAFGWPITAKNVAVTNGSQSAFFILLNILAGRTNHTGDVKKNIVFPMMPEYLGYADQVGEENVFRSFKPQIDRTGENRFKYHVDFNALTLNEDDAALCVSRPTNPTGNVLSNEELERLGRIAEQQNIPFIVDCAYGDPFPGIIYGEERMVFNPNNVYVVSCSKLGMPGVRTGIVVGPEYIVEKITQVNTVMSLANGNFGPAVMTSLMEGSDFTGLTKNMLLPFYRKQRDFAVTCIEKYLAKIPYLMHESEGAFFLWLWFPELPISTAQLYERMKERGVLIMDGSHFFFGLNDNDSDWAHTRQCIRLTFCQSEAIVERGIQLLAQELQTLF